MPPGWSGGALDGVQHTLRSVPQEYRASCSAHALAHLPGYRSFVVACQGLPARLSFNHDPLFRFHHGRANPRILEGEWGPPHLAKPMIPEVLTLADNEDILIFDRACVMSDCESRRQRLRLGRQLR